MRKKRKKTDVHHESGGFERLPSNTDFYTGAPTSEQPLYQERHVSSAQRVRKTGRHKAVGGRRKEGVDPREKMALMSILKSVVMIMLLGIAFFMLKKGISLYEESIWLENQEVKEASPVMREVSVVEDFNIEDQNAREVFAERIDLWKEAERLVRSADALVSRNNLDRAIARCQDALRLDPSHLGALDRLGELYYEQGMHVEAINAYIRILSIDPSKEEMQERLIQTLDAYGDADAVIYMSRWYLGQNHYDGDVQRYLANALYAQGEYAEAVQAFSRVLKDNPNDIEAMENLANAHMHLEEYAEALKVLEQLRVRNYREQQYYRHIAVCNAQLGKSLETVQTLGKAAHLFGQNIVVGWVQDPRLDPVREDRTFQAFADRVGGEEFRKWLEKVAKTMEAEGREDVSPQLTLPGDETIKPDLMLKPKK